MTTHRLAPNANYLIIVVLALAGACASDTRQGLLVEPPFGGGKADVGDRVTDRGPLGYGEAAAVQTEMTEDLEFHGYTLSARAGATVTLDVTQRGSSRGIDTTLFVYGPRTDANGYGSTAIATDDDAGWGRLSRLRALAFSEGGDYLVVVGTHDARGRGRYRLEARCESGDCTPIAPPPPSGVCNDAIAAAITACVTDYIDDDPDWFYSMTKRDLYEQCADIEVVAGAFDALCASASAPAELCALSLEQLSHTHLPICLGQLWNAALDAQCVFGDRYRDLFEPGAIEVRSARVLTAGTTLDTIEAQQVIAAVNAAAYEPTTVAEAFGSVDNGEINQTDLWDASNRRAFTAYEYGAGDNSYGLIFDVGTTTPTARIGDGDLYECTTTWGPETRACTRNQDCAPDLTCVPVVPGAIRGSCTR